MWMWPAMIAIAAHGRGEITFGALQAGLDIEYIRSSIGFTWEGSDEMDEVSGDGSADRRDDGSIAIEVAMTTATKPSSKPNERLLQQPASHPRAESTSDVRRVNDDYSQKLPPRYRHRHICWRRNR
jgi:hypothetical protein